MYIYDIYDIYCIYYIPYTAYTTCYAHYSLYALSLSIYIYIYVYTLLLSTIYCILCTKYYILYTTRSMPIAICYMICNKNSNYAILYEVLYHNVIPPGPPPPP